jgi:hypothetical protein|tara:strand:- start:20300 stop:20647 length:348 start_codon:yes stop_codon:yes gene_type:complete
MEELALNVTREEAIKISKNFPLLPTRGRVIITVNTDELDELDLGGAGLAESQYVIATGPHVWDEIKPGSKVMLDLDKMSVQTGQETYEIKIDPVKVGERVYAFLYDSMIKAVNNK